jgi:hypothetical protein
MSSHDHSTEDNKGKEKRETWIGIPSFIILAMLIIAYFYQSAPTTGTQSIGTNPSSQRVATQPAERYIPEHDPKLVEISGKLSKRIPIPMGYTVSFGCSHNYEVVNNADSVMYGLANHNVDIGIVSILNTSKNLLLRFKTTDSSRATLVIVFHPMKIKN